VKRRAAFVATVVTLVSSFCWASLPKLSGSSASLPRYSGDVMSRIAIHHDKYPMLEEASASPCESLAVPEALATPSPLFNGTDEVRVTLSFIVGTDGQVHSPLILEGINDEVDREVLEVVRSWRYRPALCNGAPTETEAKIEFSIR
jgi:TonB family protein